MEREELQQVFDQKCASGYDQQWSKMAPLRDALHLLIGAILSELRTDARILCVGAGTGPELLYLAERFPGWRFVAIEPSPPMLDVCRRKAEECGIATRCEFHEGYLESLPPSEAFDAATSLLVSQFILDSDVRSGFFRGIADRLRVGGFLVNSDLSSDANPAAYHSLRSPDRVPGSTTGSHSRRSIRWTCPIRTADGSTDLDLGPSAPTREEVAANGAR